MLQIIADGLVIGSIISLGAIGLTITFSILRFANFAHGDFLAWGAYFAFSALAVGVAVAWVPGIPGAAGAAAGAAGGQITPGVAVPPWAPLSFSWPLVGALAIAAALTAAMALVLDWALFKRLRLQGSITLVIASFGAALAMRNLLLFFYGGIPRYYSQELQIAIPFVPRSVAGGLRITPDQLFVLALTAVTVVALHLFLTRSTLGRSMRATAHNPQLARVAGIDPERVLRATWILGGVLAAVAGVFAGLTVQLRPTLGLDLLLPLFAAVILGGIGSVWGAVVGGLVVGLAESVSVALVGAEWRAAAAFVVLIGMLLLRPTGLFGERT
ncbi:MAG: branched-chain amino acid ABC transporter permease [Ideonella sp.]|nr:branched-chain amino acid ABC transporter permease [Ideonella sp.]